VSWWPPAIFAVLIVLLLSGIPVAFALAGTGVIFAGIGLLTGHYHQKWFAEVVDNVFAVCVENEILSAVPLFILMGMILERSRIAEELLDTAGRALRRLRGGLAIAIVGVGALLAASTGIVGATVVTMAVLSLPAMLRAGYDRPLACGTIAASGTLGQIIPPSIVLILLAAVMNVGVGELFAAAFLPGVILVACYAIYIGVRVWLDPGLAPPREGGEDETALWKALIGGVLPAFALMVIVLGSIVAGFATPTEAAGCGALGAIAIAAIKRRFSFAGLGASLTTTVRLTAMVLTILAGAQFFSQVFAIYGGPDWIERLFVGEPPDPYAEEESTGPGGILGALAGDDAAIAVTLIMLLIFVLGFFLDFLEICFIVLPIVLPILVVFGFHPTDHPDNMLLLAVLVAMNLQTSFLTPPFGFSLFYLKGSAPPEIRSGDIYRGVWPFVAIQVAVMILIACFPGLVLWLPGVLLD